MPVPLYASRPCSRWKITKILSAKRGSMPMPLSVTVNSQSSVRRTASIWIARLVAGLELDRVADEVLPHRGQQERGSPTTTGRGPTSIRAPDSSTADSRLEQADETLDVEIHVDESFGGPPHPREGEQVVDQGLHPLGPVDGELDVLVGPFVELAPVALLEQLGEAGHLAERLLQVVGGYIGELLELDIGSAQFLVPAVQLGMGTGDIRQVADDPAAHGLDVQGQVGDLGWPGHPDGVGEIAGCHLACVGAQAEERFGHPQPEGAFQGDPATRMMAAPMHRAMIRSVVADSGRPGRLAAAAQGTVEGGDWARSWSKNCLPRSSESLLMKAELCVRTAAITGMA